MIELKKWLVIYYPKRSYANAFATLFAVVEARSAAAAIRWANENGGPTRAKGEHHYTNPVARELVINKFYRA